MLNKISEFVAEPLPRRILFFDDLLTPSLIRALYWLGLLSVAWSGLGKMFSDGFFGFFEGIVYIVIGVIVLRVASELVMLLFKINENLEVMAGEVPAQSKTVDKTPVEKKPTASKKPPVSSESDK